MVGEAVRGGRTAQEGAGLTGARQPRSITLSVAGAVRNTTYPKRTKHEGWMSTARCRAHDTLQFITGQPYFIPLLLFIFKIQRQNSTSRYCVSFLANNPVDRRVCFSDRELMKFRLFWKLFLIWKSKPANPKTYLNSGKFVSKPFIPVFSKKKNVFFLHRY